MQQQDYRLYIGIGILLALLLAACNPFAPTAQPTSAPTAAAEQPTAIPTSPTDAPGSADSAEQATARPESNNGRILAWVAPGPAPGLQTASGELVLMDSDGSMTTIMGLPERTSNVMACGANATSPDGRIFVFMSVVTISGVDTAALHLMRDSSAELDTIATDLNPLSCVGSSGFDFSDDGNHFAFIDWPEGASNAVSPNGRLKIFNTADAQEISNFENVTDFALTGDGAAFISFFTNEVGQASEAGIFTWDGETDREISTLRADEACYYTSGALTPIAGGQLAVVLGYRCTGGSTQWQLHMVDPANRIARLEETANTGGRYFGFTDTNAVFTSPDGATLWFTVPDGVSNQTVSIRTAPVESLAVATVIERFAVMPSATDLPYDANNATARISPDGRFLAVVINDADNNATLAVIDLTNPDAQPTQIDAGERGDKILDMRFNRESSHLYFVAGGDEGVNNSLFVLDLTTGTDSRLSRGRFAQGALSPDGTQIAIMQWVLFDEDKAPYLTLEALNTETGASTTIYEGGEVVDGQLRNPSFAYPLSWRTR